MSVKYGLQCVAGFVLALSAQSHALAEQPNQHPTARFVLSHPELTTTRLHLHHAINATLGGPDVHRYVLPLRRGQFSSVTVDQISGNVVAVVFDPDGELVSIVDENGSGFGEVATIFAEKTGPYSVQIAMFEWDAPAGVYSIEWRRRERARYDAEGRTDQLFRSWYDADAPGAAIAVLRDGDLAYHGAIGVENTESLTPITLHTEFDLASISKQFTAYGVALLIDCGQLRLDDDIRRYLPELPDYGSTITIQHLLEHTSGLRDWDGLFALTGRGIEDGISTDDVLAMTARQSRLNFEPGSEQRYTNTGYVLLAKIVERVSGEPFDFWMRANVFEPLGARECGFERARTASADDQVQSYRGRFPQPQAASVLRMVTMGSSALECSVHDLSLWLANYESGVVGGDSVRRMVNEAIPVATGSPSDYVFGNWHGDREGRPFFGHQGLAAGFRTSMHSFPEQHLAVIYLANDGNDATYQRVRRIENLYLGIPEPTPEAPSDNYTPSAPTPLSETDTAQLVGSYYSAELQTSYDIVRAGQGIAAVHRLVGTIMLTPQSSNDFTSPNSVMPSLTFIREGNGVATAFQVNSDDVTRLEFQRQGSTASR